MNTALDYLVQSGERKIADKRHAEEERIQADERKRQLEAQARLDCLMNEVKALVPLPLADFLKFPELGRVQDFNNTIHLEVEGFAPISFGVRRDSVQQGNKQVGFSAWAMDTSKNAGFTIASASRNDRRYEGDVEIEWNFYQPETMDLEVALALAKERGLQYSEMQAAAEQENAQRREQREKADREREEQERKWAEERQAALAETAGTNQEVVSTESRFLDALRDLIREAQGAA